VGGTSFLSLGDKDEGAFRFGYVKHSLNIVQQKCRLAYAVSSMFGGGLGLVARSGKLTGGCRVFELASADISL